MRPQLHFLFDYVFPNIAMPNALMTEYSIVNYLHSLHSDKLVPDAFSDPGQYGNFAQTMFNNKLGKWPNSLRQNSSHLNSPFYTDHFEYIENSLFFGKQSVDRYIYLIKVTPHLDDFIGVNLGTGNKANGEYFWKHMSSIALKDVQEGKAFIFLDYAQENFIEKRTYENLHQCLLLSGIPKQQVILAFNALNAQEVYESWFTPEERQLEVKSWPWVMCSASWHYSNNPTQCVSFEELNETRFTLRENYFLFKVRSPRTHRLILLIRMASDGLLEKADWSCLNYIHYTDVDLENLSAYFQFEFDTEKTKELYNKVPHFLQSEIGSDYQSISAWTDKNADAHKNSYFYVCTETYAHGEYKMLTEKVFKPIVNFQPFFFVAYPGALHKLRELGFKTFSPFIDESYDNETNEVTRIQKIYAEITRLCNMPKEEIHAWYWSMEDILIHNHNRVLELYKDDIKGIELIKYLVERTSS